MKRPHSAKPIRSFAPQVLGEDSIEEGRHFLKSGKRHLASAVSVSNDLSRLLPKKIHHDKEQLYHENLQLKASLNEVNEENMRLKTKIALYQREKDRLHKTDTQTLTKGKSSNNLNPRAEKQNGIVNGLKKIVREAREENDALKAEVARLKKSLKYTKLNEVEVERQTIYEENKKLAKLVHQYENELTSRLRQDQEVEHLQAELNEKTRTLKQVTSDNIRYQQILEEVETQCRQASEKLLIQEKKWQRNFAVEKRKFDQLTKHVELLKAEVNSLSQKLEQERKKGQQRKSARPVSSHPYTTSEAPRNKDMKEKEEAMQANSRLKLQLQEAKKKLAESENRLKNNSKNVTNTLELSKNQTFELNLTKEQPNINRHKQEQEEYYGSDFQENISKVPQKIQSLPIEQKVKGKSRPQAKLSGILSEIKELLTYRLKYNRYTFEQLQSDIEVSPDSTFIYEDLMSMLTSEPFYLTPHYATEFLRACYGRTSVQNDDQLELGALLRHLRLVVDDFELQEEEEEERMLYKIAENLTRNRKVLEGEFARVKDGKDCVTKTQLARILRSVSKLSEEEIELAICYISINTDSLQAISYTDFLERFYINSRSLSSQAPPKHEDELSMGENENLDESELIVDDELI